MRILLVDTTEHFPVSPLFGEAMETLGGGLFIDEKTYLGEAGVVKRLAARVLRRMVDVRHPGSRALNEALLKEGVRFGPDVVLVVKGACVKASTLARIKSETGAKIVNFATDDPFNRRVSSPDILECISEYDLYVCTKRAVLPDVVAAGAKAVSYLPFAYKPDVHFPEDASSVEERRRYESDVVFIGGADSDRVPFLEELVAKMPQIRLHLYGGYWGRSWGLRRYYRGFAVGRAYRLATSGARIVLNLVRRANRDGHVMRTFEVPAMGGFLLSERTEEHAEILGPEGMEASFMDSGEMIERIHYFLGEESMRRRIKDSVMDRIRGGRNRYADRLQTILDCVMELPR